MTEPNSLSGIAALGIDAKGIIFQIVNIVILLFILKWVAYQPILKVLDERREKINHSLKAAKKMEEKEAKWAEKMEALRRQTNQEAQKILQSSQMAAKKEAEKIVNQALKQQKEMIEQTHRRLTQERKNLIDEVKQEAAQLVALATARVLEEKIDSQKDSTLIAKALKSMKKER